MANIITAGALLPSTADTPLDVRTRISNLDAVESIDNPYTGMIFYCTGTGKLYKVKTLKSVSIGGGTGYAVDTYEEFGGGGTGSAADVSIEDTGEYFVASNVEAALQEIGSKLGESIATLEFAVAQSDGDADSKTVSVRTVTRNEDGTSTYNGEAKTVFYDFSVPADSAETPEDSTEEQEE